MRTVSHARSCALPWLKLIFALLLFVLVLPARAQSQADSVVVRADTLVLHDRSSAVGQECGKVVLRDPSVGLAVCRDTNARSLMVPQASTSQTAVTVGYGQRVVLDTGSHGDVLVRSGATLVLPKGKFRLSSLTLEWDAQLVLDSTSLGDSGTVFLDVTNSVHLMDRVTVGIGAVRNGGALRSAQALTVVAGNLQFDNDLCLGGQFYAVKAITLGDRVSFTGVLSAKNIAIGYDTKLIYAASLAHGEVVADEVQMVSPQDNSWTNATSLAVKWTVNGVAYSDVESLPLEGPKVIRRCAGNVCVQVTVNVDRTAPAVKILSPADGWITNKAGMELVWSVDSIQRKEIITLPEGASTVTRSVTDSAGNTGSATVHVTLDTHIPVVKILSPADGFLTNAASQTLRYSVDGIEQLPVTVALAEGSNVLTRSFTSKAGNTGTASIIVRLDTQPPVIAFVSPKDGDTLQQNRVAVSWTVDGVLRQDTEYLSSGKSRIDRSAKDSAGNIGSSFIEVFYQEAAMPGTLQAPPVKKVPSPAFSSGVDFLWKGVDTIQKGVTQGSLDLKKLSVLRGTVLDADGAALQGARISLLGHPEWGYTISRADGWFDLAVNVGQTLVVDVQKDGYAPSQRRVIPDADEYVHVPSIRLVKLDSKVTQVDLSGTKLQQQILQGSTQTDEDGSRTPTIVIPASTNAWMLMPDGSKVSASSLSVRATEYTVGPEGVARMPGDLPEGVAYTYAVELSADEAIAAGASHVVFSQPVILYLENFPGFPVGNAVPLGWYDRSRGVWVASNSGRVIRILGVQNGLAQLDIDGSGSAASPAALAYLWITREELTDLATRYATGASFWRVGIEHFSAWDMNWGIAPPADATSPEPYVETKEQDTHCTKCPGSIVGVEDRSLGEAIEIPGTGKSLIFSSNRTDGFTAGRKFVIQLSGASVTPSLLRIDLDIEVAGQHFSKTFPPNTNLTETFIWNGKDGYGRDISSARVVATVRNVYKAVYQSVPKFGYNGNGTKIEANRAAAIFSFPTTVTAAVTRELGDPWQISGVDVLQQGIHKVQMSDGGVVEYGSLTGNEVGFVRNVQGTGVAFAKDGSYWIANHTYSMVYHYTEIGEKISETYVSGVIGVSIANDGSAIVSGYNGVGRVHIDGTLEPLVAQSGFSGDGGPAQNARVSGGVWDVAVDPIGQVLIADTWNGRIRRIALDGTITTVAGNGNSLVIGSTGLATSVGLGYPYAVASGRDGSIYMGTGNSNSEMVIRKIDPKGVIHTIAGGGYRSGAFANGFLGTEASLGWVIGLVELSNGDVCWTEYDRHISRCLDAKGIVYGFLGTGTADRGVDGVVASESAITYPEGMDQSPNGVVYVLDAGNNRLRSVTIGPKSGDNPVVLTTDGRVRAFNLDGRPQAILSAASYDTLRRFNYDDSLQLQSIVERNGDSISIERNGNALQITGPTRLGSKVTTFQKDGNGRYVQALLPDGRSYQMTYLPNGLLESFVTPRGARNIFAYTSEGELVSDSAVGAGTQRLSEQNDDGLRTVTRTDASGATQVFSKWENDDTTFREQSALGGASTLMESLDNGTEITRYPDGSRIQRVPRADPQWGMAQPLYDEIQTLADGTSLTVHHGAAASFATHGDPLSVTRRIDTIKSRGITTIADWNPLTRTLVQKGPSGLATTIRFDHLDRVIDVKYGDSVIQSASYNDVTGLETWINQGVTTKVWRNLEGPIDSVLGPDGDTLRYLRDIDHQTVAMPQPGGGQVNLLWDARGRMVGLKPWEKGVHQFLFNSWGGDSLYVPPTVSGANGQVGYSYDELGRLKVIRYSASDSVVASVDGQSRTSSVQFNGNALSFGYTGDNSAFTSATRTFADGSVQNLARSVTGSRLDGESWSGIVAGSVTRGWNANQSLSSLSVNGQAINYAWGTDGHLAQVGDAHYQQDPISTRLNGMTLGFLVMNQNYDHQGLGSQIGDSVRFQNALVYGRHLKYDSSGRISESSEFVNGVAKMTRYHYALGGQLDSVWINGALNGAYSYDNNGNRSDAVVDSQDQLVNSGSCAYGHDAKGQRASMTCPDGTTTYGYDLLGNLLRVSKPNGQVIEYVVDAQGRRIGRKENGILAQRFLYDGQLTPVAELDATGQVVSRFVYGGRENAPDYMIKNGVNYRLVSDERGSIRLVVNAATGAVVSSLEYDAWGNVTGSVNASFQPFGFAGGLRDDATGLTRFGVRDYDAKLGRWTAKDPISFSGGLMNLYGYVGNDPVNLVDPMGRRERGLNSPMEFELGGSGGGGANGGGGCGGGGSTYPLGSVFGDHGADRAFERGFSPDRIQQVVKNGNPEDGMGRYGPQIKYKLGDNTVVIPTDGRNSGKVITVFSTQTINGVRGYWAVTP